jgi:hypothetical protein
MFGRKGERFVGMDPAQLTLALDGMDETIRKGGAEQISYTRKKPVKEAKKRAWPHADTCPP